MHALPVLPFQFALHLGGRAYVGAVPFVHTHGTGSQNEDESHGFPFVERTVISRWGEQPREFFPAERTNEDGLAGQNEEDAEGNAEQFARFRLIVNVETVVDDHINKNECRDVFQVSEPAAQPEDITGQPRDEGEHAREEGTAPERRMERLEQGTPDNPQRTVRGFP